MTPEALREEIQSGPLADELKPHLEAGNDVAIADALNQVREGTRIRRGTVSRDDVLSDFVGATMAVAAHPAAAVRARWIFILDYIVKPRETLNLASAKVDQLMGLALADGLFSAEDAEAIIHRDGSRAEAQWGAGTVIIVDQVSECFAEERRAAQIREDKS